MRKLKVKETSHELSQFTTVTSPPAVPFIFIGNIWKKKTIGSRKVIFFKLVTRLRRRKS